MTNADTIRVLSKYIDICGDTKMEWNESGCGCGGGDGSVQCKMLLQNQILSVQICGVIGESVSLNEFHVAFDSLIHAKSFSVLHSIGMFHWDSAIAVGLNGRDCFFCASIHIFFFLVASFDWPIVWDVFIEFFFGVHDTRTQESIQRTRLTDDEPNVSNDSKQ